MIPGMNPKKMQQMMRQMGIQQVEIPAQEVIIRTAEVDIVIAHPQVSKVNMMGQSTYQIVGDVQERRRNTTVEITSDDIETVVEQTGVSEQKAKEAIMAAQGDLAEAILRLQG